MHRQLYLVQGVLTKSISCTQTSITSIPIKRNKWISLEERKDYYFEGPEGMKPEPPLYYGPEKLKSAYVFEREPAVQPRGNYLHDEFEEGLVDENETFYARHQYTTFWDYYPDWQKEKKKRDALSKKQKPVGKAAHIYVPPRPQPNAEDKMFLQRTNGRGYMTSGAEFWLDNWKPQPVYTQDDFDDNRYSLKRNLKGRLYLIFQSVLNKKWMFPEVIRRNPLSMRQAAEKRFLEDMRKTCTGHFNSNIPLHYYKNPQDDLDKTYFYHAFYVGGKPQYKQIYKERGYCDHAWVTRHQLLEYDYIDEDYKEAVYDMCWGTPEVCPRF
ncbi:ribosomal protein mL46 [Acrasis kona]|uniref:Ribosomal protein mL46 n=1 Tax=Acrasis kona TaxID=1008807 RepID=A0AAW2Z4P3_9EUKA